MNNPNLNNPQNIPEMIRPFGHAPLQNLLEKGERGFHYTQGFHVYCELRPRSQLEFADDDSRALRYVQLIEEFVNHGVQAATPYNIALLELQGNVLHFYKEAGLTNESVLEVLQFVYLFTSTLYDEMKPEFGEDWHGFASCLDHGSSIIIRHKSTAGLDTISLGPVANQPAKQLLYGKTPAGSVDVPSAWAKFLGSTAPGSWYTINLRDRERFPFIGGMENTTLRRQYQARMQAYRQDKNRPRVSAIERANRIQGTCIQADLDGFSAAVKRAFDAGHKAIEATAAGFAEILDFGDYMRRSTPGAVALPWAGDRAPTIVPKAEWLNFAMRWQSFASGTSEAKRRGWANIFKDVGWSIGGCHGKSGSNIVVPIVAQGRNFLVATGWPMAVSMEAQNLGKGDEIVTHGFDHADFDPATKALFTKVISADFWKTAGLTPDKIKHAAIESGKAKSPAGSDYLSKYSTIQIPSPRPHLR